MDWILLIVPGVIWGTSFLFIAEGLEAMGPNGVTFTRILVGFLVLALFPGSRGPVRRADWLGIALVGVLWMAFPLSMFPYAEQHVSSALTGMLNGALPVIWRAQAVALVLTAPLGLPEVLNAHWSLAPLLSLLALGALGTGVAYVLMVMAAGRVGATKASATAFLIPPVALLLGVLVRGEHVATLSVLGGAVCLAGAWLMRRAQLEHPVRAPAPAMPAPVSVSGSSQ